MSETASGIVLQISDVFVEELNKVDKDASLENIAKLLEPFLMAIAGCECKELSERIQDNIFKPILENNKTIPDESDDEEEMAK